MRGPCPTAPERHWQPAFLTLLPRIEHYARFALRGLPADRRAEAVQEVTANACAAYARLAAQGRTGVATGSSLARYAVAQYRDGRRVGTRRNVRDVCSPCGRRHRPVHRQSLDRGNAPERPWGELLLADHRTPVPDQAAFRCDFPRWLRTLSRRNRRIALRLARGDSTSGVARRFGLSAGRISQLRHELCQAWQRFHGELVSGPAAVPA